MKGLVINAPESEQASQKNSASPSLGVETAATASEAFGPQFVTPMLFGAALNPLNSSVMATALVAIASSLGVSVGRSSILIASLYLTSAVAQPTTGRLGELIGPRRVFVAGTALVLLGGFVGGFGDNLLILTIARVLIGMGTSTGYPTAMLLIRRRASTAGLTAPPQRVLGSLTIAGAAMVAIGPALGGLLISWFNWRAAFLINVPIACAALLTALLWLPKDPDRIRGYPWRELITRVDLVGITGFAITLTCALTFLLSLPRPRISVLAASLLVAIALICWELRARYPFLDIRLLVSNMALTRTYLRNGLTLLAVYIVLYGLTQWMEAARGLTAYTAGLTLIPMGVLSALSAQVGSRRLRMGTSLTISAALMLAAGLIACSLNGHSPLVLLVTITALVGVVSGLCTLANQIALYEQAPAHTVGTASGLLRTYGYIGSIAAATICGMTFRTRVDDTGLHRLVAALIAVSMVVLALTVADRKLYARSNSRNRLDARRP
ncbi:MFS transporter [Mycobacterium saskatchewanense]|uniref:MFS transporter n=1 Tax=Mycobacterium saskatchewanense TaxID=220927 RepID=UPI00138B9297|nr:MFS transporter [Mycobacterium saskatchewanense]BBX63512.1 MFS transporter [Mycobacterium saskatchewanense]